MRKVLWGSLAAAAVTCALVPTAIAAPPSTAEVVAVFGDLPYGTSPGDTAQFLKTSAYVGSINADPDVHAVLDVGDIHSGKQFCTEAYDRSIFDKFAAFEDPFVYTPGDNEWTDCHKPAEGGGTYNATTGAIDLVKDADGNPVDYAGGNPVANLALIRSIFFPQAGFTLGQHPQPVLSQAQFAANDRAHPGDAKYVENVIYSRGKTLVVAIDLPGGSNNDTDVWYGAPTQSPEQAAEIAERTAADLRWLDLAFSMAHAGRYGSVVIAAQADMWDPEKGAAHQTQYEPFVASVASHTLDLGKPVLMLNGDSHVYQAGNPLSPDGPNANMHPGYDVPNFERIVVHGSTTPLEWLKLTIDPAAQAPRSDTAFGPFSWERVIPTLS